MTETNLRLSQVFLYKFLNDKFVHEVKQLDDKIAKADNWEAVLKENTMHNDYEMLMMQMSESTAACSKHFISSLFERQK
jgi:type I restriction enzyme M protein